MTLKVPFDLSAIDFDEECPKHIEDYVEQQLHSRAILDSEILIVDPKGNYCEIYEMPTRHPYHKLIKVIK